MFCYNNVLMFSPMGGKERTKPGFVRSPDTLKPLMEKMERWEYLEDLAQKIANLT